MVLLPPAISEVNGKNPKAITTPHTPACIWNTGELANTPIVRPCLRSSEFRWSGGGGGREHEIAFLTISKAVLMLKV